MVDQQGPIPTWMIYCVTLCGFVSLVCIAVYTHRITSGRRASVSEQRESYCACGDVPQELLKSKSKHVVEMLLLRGGRLAALTCSEQAATSSVTVMTRARADTTKVTIPTISVLVEHQYESHS